MKNIPQYIINEIQSHINHIQKSEECRSKIEDWFLKNGKILDVDTNELSGGTILDILIDAGMDGDLENCLALMLKELNNDEDMGVGDIEL